jgi:hypothetical protein
LNSFFNKANGQSYRKNIPTSMECYTEKRVY